MIYLQIFWAFFITNILGYGGGPPSIPLIQNEVVTHYMWMTVEEFGETLALANALPSPISTELGGCIGYQVAGIPGAMVGLFATVAPTALAVIGLLGVFHLFRQAPQIKAMTHSIRPIVTVLLGTLAVQFILGSCEQIGLWHTLILGSASYFLMEQRKVHPAFVIILAMGYGGFFIK